MKRSLETPSALDLIEEAVQLLRGPAASALVAYHLGSLPFVLALLYFWTDMGRSPRAYQHLAGASFVMAVLFLWMKFCQAIFAGNLFALIAGEPRPRLDFARCSPLFLLQTIIPPT